MMGESGNGNWPRLVTNLNLTLEIFVAGPLNRERVQRTNLTIPRKNDTNDNADMCCRLVSEWNELLCVAKTIAPTSGRGFNGKTKSPIHALEKDGHLQYSLINVLPLIGNGVQGPHCLGEHSASVYDSAVKKPRGRVKRLP